MQNNILSSSKIYNEFLFKPDEIRPMNIIIDIEGNSPIMEYCVLLGALKGKTFIASGTGTFIAPYLIITAKHVIEDYCIKFNKTPIQKSTNIDFEIIAAQFVKGKPTVTWYATCINYNNSTDIAYMQVIPYKNANNYKFHTFPTIQFSPPKIGSKLICFGYRKTKANVNNIVWIRGSASVSKGEVIEIHEEKRDNFSLFFPCIHTNAAIEGGMSGGPVFDEHGYLVAINTASMNFNSSKEEPLSYVSLIWASVGLKFNLDYKDQDKIRLRRECTMLDLYRSNYIHSKSHNRIVIYPNGGHISLGRDSSFFYYLDKFNILNIKDKYYNDLLLLKRHYKIKNKNVKINYTHAILLFIRMLRKISGN